jgi:hypothetical protein
MLDSEAWEASGQVTRAAARPAVRKEVVRGHAGPRCKTPVGRTGVTPGRRASRITRWRQAV